jgi:hypothetical protein
MPMPHRPFHQAASDAPVSSVVRTVEPRAAAALTGAGLYVVGGWLLLSRLFSVGLGPIDHAPACCLKVPPTRTRSPAVMSCQYDLVGQKQVDLQGQVAHQRQRDEARPPAAGCVLAPTTPAQALGLYRRGRMRSLS